MAIEPNDQTPFVGVVEVPDGAEPVGYAWLHLTLQLSVMPHHRWSFSGASRRELRDGPTLRVVYPLRTADPTRMRVLDHVLFSLKHDGANLEILSALFERHDAGFEADLAEEVRRRPTSKYVRRLFYLFELLTERPLDVPDATTGNYVPLLDPSEYVTGPARRSRRHHVDDNLLGDRRFSPMVRRTATLRAQSPGKLRERLLALIGRYDDDALRRATS